MSFIEFIERSQGPEEKYVLTEVVNTKGEHLGWVSWFPKWKKYVFNSSYKDTVYDEGCLEEISIRVRTLNKYKGEL